MSHDRAIRLFEHTEAVGRELKVAGKGAETQGVAVMDAARADGRVLHDHTFGPVRESVHDK